MFYSCGGAQKLLQTYEEDLTMCLPLTSKRRASDGKPSRRCGVLPCLRVTILVLVLTLLLLMLLYSVRHPSTQVRTAQH